MYSSSRESARVLQLALHSSKEGWEIASYQSMSVKPYFEEIRVQNVEDSTYRDSNQGRGLVYHNRGRIL